eukprot:scaffold12234_cov112-Isochrysis_galbana.AAC.4
MLPVVGCPLCHAKPTARYAAENKRSVPQPWPARAPKNYAGCLTRKQPGNPTQTPTPTPTPRP